MTQTVTTPAFAGTADEQQLAHELLRALQFQGQLFASGTPVRQPMAALAEYATARKLVTGDAASQVEAAVRANPAVFALETANEQVIVVTTREGISPLYHGEDLTHTFRTRLTEPTASVAPAVAAQVRPAPPNIHDNWYNEIIVPDDATDDDEPDTPSAMEELAAAYQAAVVEMPLDTAVSPAEAVAEADAELAEVEAAALDVSTPAGALERAISEDGRFVTFGPDYYLREQLESYGRNDTRRIREYLQERNEPLSDADILEDVYGKRRSDSDFAATCFSLDVHLAGENDFEFVGTAERRLWSVVGLPTVGTDRRKPNDIGQDYRTLVDYPTMLDTDAPDDEYVEHLLTYYEYEYGVLPLDGDLARFFPLPYARGQRSAIVTFEAPQHYLTFNVEIRFPTGNRGGFLTGFSTFFHENLVPGAFFTIERGDTPGTYRIQYLQVSAQERKLLVLDEKKGRFTFKPVTFYCATSDASLLSEQRLPRLAQMKPLDARDRRSTTKIVSTAFERGGENADGRLIAEYDDLFALSNIERPTSPEALRAVITANVDGFTEEDGLYYYTPTT